MNTQTQEIKKGTLLETAFFIYKIVAQEQRAGQMEMIRQLCTTCELAWMKNAQDATSLQVHERPVEVQLGEIPTGTGKSLAVLVTALAAWLQWGAKSVFATHTHVLQDQILSKDIPELKRKLSPIIDLTQWKSTLVKSLENHPCRLRVKQLLALAENSQNHVLLVNSTRGGKTLMASRLKEIDVNMRESTFEMSADDYTFSCIRASKQACLGHECPYQRACPYYVSIRVKAPFIITNHAFLLEIFKHQTEVQEENHGESVSPFLSADFYFIDEAHHLMGYRTLGKTVASISKNGADVLTSFVAPSNDAMLFQSQKKVRKRFQKWYKGALESLEHHKTIQSPDIIFNDWENLMSGKHSLLKKEIEQGLCEARFLQQKIMEFQYLADTMRQQGEPIVVTNNGSDIRAFISEENNLLKDFNTHIPFLKGLFCFSGTLFINGNEEIFSVETGITPTRPSFKVLTPFSYDAIRIWVPEQEPLGKHARSHTQKNTWHMNTSSDLFFLSKQQEKEEREEEHKTFVDAFCCAYIPPFIKENLGGVLILSTSLRRMDEITTILRAKFEEEGIDRWRVLKQGEASKKSTVRKFAKAPISTVLVGSASFREGFDVPGDGLTWVIIDRLPFSVPGSEQAQNAEKLADWGLIDNSFAHGLSMMKLHLEQSAGRLVRSSYDWGAISILDSRVLTKKDWQCHTALPVSPEKWNTDLPEVDAWVESMKSLRHHAQAKKMAEQEKNNIQNMTIYSDIFDTMQHELIS